MFYQELKVSIAPLHYLYEVDDINSLSDLREFNDEGSWKQVAKYLVKNPISKNIRMGSVIQK